MAALLAGLGTAGSSMLSGLTSGLGGAAASGSFGSILGNLVGQSVMGDVAQDTGVGKGALGNLTPWAGGGQTGQAANQQAAQAPQSLSSVNPNQYTQSPSGTPGMPSLIQSLLQNPYGAR